MFEQESSQHQKKESQGHLKKTETSSSWLNNLRHWFLSFSPGDTTRDIAHKLKQIEKAKAEEKKILLQQRNFYERLFSRSTEAKDKTILHTLESKEEIIHPLAKKVEAPQAVPLPHTAKSAPLRPLVKTASVSGQDQDAVEKKIIPIPKAPHGESFFSTLFSRLFGKKSGDVIKKNSTVPPLKLEVPTPPVPSSVNSIHQEIELKPEITSAETILESPVNSLEHKEAKTTPTLQPPPIISDLQAPEIAVPSPRPSVQVTPIAKDISGVILSPALNTKKTTFDGVFSRIFGGSLKSKLAKERESEVTLQERNSVEQRVWQPSNGFNPNLIKNQEVIFFKWHENILVLCLALVMCCLAISLTYVGFLIWQKERQDSSKIAFLNVKVIDDQIAKSEIEIKEIKEFNKKLVLVSGLLDNHVYWTNFLDLLESTTLKDVYYEKFSGDISGKYTIPAVASSLEAISLQLEVMKGYDKVESVAPDTGQTSADGSQVQFNLGLTVDPLVFTK